MPARKPDFVAHQHLSLVLCESPAVLEEVSKDIDFSAYQIQRIGSRALALPHEHLEAVRRELYERGTYPRVIGERPEPETDDNEEGEDAS